MPAITSSKKEAAVFAGHQTELIAFFNSMDEVFFSVDLVNGRLLQISNACEKLFGYTADEMMANNRLWFELPHHDDKPLIDDEHNTLRGGSQINTQHRIIHRDGSVRWVEKRGIPVIDAKGNLLRVDGVVRDITSRRNDEEQYRKSEAMYRQIVETAQEGIWTIDENEKTNFVNQKMGAMLGYTSDEMMGKELYDFMDAEGKAYALACMERRRNGAKENLDIRYVTKDGRDLWANISANPIFDDSGNYKGALAMVIDITQRRANEEALKKSEANLRTIFDNTDISYILFDAELRIVSFNALAQKYSETHNRKKLEINKPISDYFAASRWPFVQQILERVAEGETVSYELNFTNSDGTVKWHNVRWLNVQNNDNKTWGFILANQDITAAKTAALERERITADLIQHNKDLEQFTYIVSHNLRAPVANIMGLSDMLKEHDDPAIKEEVVDKVSSSIKNIDTVIQDLNHILQARKPVNEQKETVYFKKLADDIKTSIYSTLEKENVQLNCICDEVESIFTIRSYLYSIFYNLVSNSIKYRQTGVAPVITITSHQLKNKIELRFKDNGKGIDLKKNGQDVFGLYKRFDTSVEGKGMGLFMVKTQVETLGGTIQIKSKPGQGTEFIIQF